MRRPRINPERKDFWAPIRWVAVSSGDYRGRIKNVCIVPSDLLDFENLSRESDGRAWSADRPVRMNLARGEGSALEGRSRNREVLPHPAAKARGGGAILSQFQPLSSPGRPAEKRQGRYRNAYLNGVKALVGREIWRAVEEWHSEQCGTEEKLATEIGFDLASVSRGLKDGELSLAGLIHILVRSRRDWRHLPGLPPADKRKAVGIAQTKARLGLSDDEFQCLWFMTRHVDRWKKFQVICEALRGQAEELKRILRRDGLWDVPELIARKAEQALGRKLDLGSTPGPDRESLVRELLALDDRGWPDYQEALPWITGPDWEGA